MAMNFLEAFAPYLQGQPDGLVSPGDTTPLSAGGPTALSPMDAPAMRDKRSFGNVLHDFFSGSRIASNMRDPGHAAWGDFLSNIARLSRGEDPTHTQMDYAQQLQQRDQQQAEWDRSNQARNAFADLLLGNNPQSEAALARADPATLLGYRQQEQAAQQQQIAQAREIANDQFNHGKPIPLGGNGGYAIYAPNDPGANSNGFVIKEGAPPLQRFETGEGQAGLVDPRTGRFTPIGGKKIPATNNKVVTVQGDNGPEIRIIGPNGEPIRTIGAAPAKGGKAAPNAAGDVINVLKNNGISLTGPVPVADLIRGSTNGTVQNIGSKVAGLFGGATSGAQNIGKLATIDRSVVLALAGGKLGAGVSNADRDFFNDMAGQISDPNTPVDKRLAAWSQVRARLKRITERQAQTPAAGAPSTNNSGHAAELQKRGYHFNGTQWVK